MIEQDPPPERPRPEPLPIAVIVLIATNVAAFAFSVSTGADAMAPTPDQIFALGGNFGPATLDGEWWRLASSMFLHYGFIHLASNMFSLFVIGKLVERYYGRGAFVAVYLFAGLGGSLASAIAAQAVSAGASGAVFGVMGGLAAYLLVHRATLDKEVLSRQAQWLGIILALNIVSGLRISAIDNYAHGGGLIAGLLAGLILARKPTTPRVLAVFLGSLLIVVAANVLPPPKATALLASTKAKFDDFAKLEEKALARYNELVGNDKLTEDEVANAIDLEVLPVWREGKALVWSLDHLPEQIQTNLRAYIETRERAWVSMVAALRKKDQAALAEALNTMGEAEKYVELLKQ